MSLSGSGTTTSKAESVRIPRTEEFYRKIYQQVATGIAITDWQGVFQECNPAFCTLLGYTEKELRTMGFVSLIHPEDREANLAHVRRLQVGEIPSFEIENRYIRKNGEPVWVRKFVSVLHGEEEVPTHLIALVTNVTERKQAEEAIKESEMRYRGEFEGGGGRGWGGCGGRVGGGGGVVWMGDAGSGGGGGGMGGGGYRGGEVVVSR